MASNGGENTPLLGSNENQNYYFLNASAARKFSDAGEYVEDLPPGASAEEFAPRQLNAAGNGPTPAAGITELPPKHHEQGLFSKYAAAATHLEKHICPHSERGKKQHPGSQVYGLIMLPVAICFILYAMFQYTRRAYMIRNKHPGPYDDTVGPTLLGIILMISIVAQFAIKLYSIAA
eukprot:scaffold9308_cov115-Cylindrotheca_fusiformis.AAC.9